MFGNYKFNKIIHGSYLNNFSKMIKKKNRVKIGLKIK